MLFVENLTLGHGVLLLSLLCAGFEIVVVSLTVSRDKFIVRVMRNV